MFFSIYILLIIGQGVHGKEITSPWSVQNGYYRKRGYYKFYKSTILCV